MNMRQLTMFSVFFATYSAFQVLVQGMPFLGDQFLAMVIAVFVPFIGMEFYL